MENDSHDLLFAIHLFISDEFSGYYRHGIIINSIAWNKEKLYNNKIFHWIGKKKKNQNNALFTPLWFFYVCTEDYWFLSLMLFFVVVAVKCNQFLANQGDFVVVRKNFLLRERNFKKGTYRRRRHSLWWKQVYWQDDWLCHEKGT